jgi:hypothetical protein
MWQPSVSTVFTMSFIRGSWSPSLRILGLSIFLFLCYLKTSGLERLTFLDVLVMATEAQCLKSLTFLDICFMWQLNPFCKKSWRLKHTKKGIDIFGGTRMLPFKTWEKWNDIYWFHNCHKLWNFSVHLFVIHEVAGRTQ